MAISAPIKNRLEENHVAFSILTHASAHTAQGAAAVIHVSGRELAKTVVVQAGKEYYLAVLPALCHIQREALSQVIGHPAQLASEREFDSLFPDCELGAMPPLGELYALPVYVNESLIANAGTHRDAVRVNFDDFVSLARPTVRSFAAKG